MSIYTNIDGTIKGSFKIGLKGVELSTRTELTDVGKGKFQSLLVNGAAVITEDSILIPQQNVYKFTKNDTGNKCTFFYRYYDKEQKLWFDDEITLVTQKGANGIEAVKNPTDGNIVVFDGTSGYKVKDSGFKIVTTINEIINDNTNDDTGIPTISVLKEYVGKVEEPLRKRLDGIIEEE